MGRGRQPSQIWQTSKPGCAGCHTEGRRRQSRPRGASMRGVSTISRLLAAALLVATSLTFARAQQMPLQDKPFAEHKVVLQLSDNDPKKQGLVISVANNLMKFYDPDKVAVEIVAFGPGIDLLKPDNPVRKQVESL